MSTKLATVIEAFQNAFDAEFRLWHFTSEIRDRQDGPITGMVMYIPLHHIPREYTTEDFSKFTERYFEFNAPDLVNKKFSYDSRIVNGYLMIVIIPGSKKYFTAYDQWSSRNRLLRILFPMRYRFLMEDNLRFIEKKSRLDFFPM